MTTTTTTTTIAIAIPAATAGGDPIVGRNIDGLPIALNPASRILWFPTPCCNSRTNASGEIGPYCAACRTVVDDIHLSMGVADDIVERL